MPDKFKTPSQALVNIETGDKILVMDEATRAKLIERRREKLLGFKAARDAQGIVGRLKKCNCCTNCKSLMRKR